MVTCCSSETSFRFASFRILFEFTCWRLADLTSESSVFASIFQTSGACDDGTFAGSVKRFVGYFGATTITFKSKGFPI